MEKQRYHEGLKQQNSSNNMGQDNANFNQQQQQQQQINQQQNVDPAQQEAERIKKLIACVCEEGQDQYFQNITKLISQLSNYLNTKKKETQDVIIQYFVDSICLLNCKGSIYATIIALLNSKQIFDVCDMVIDKVLQRLQSAIDNGNMVYSKNIIIFLGELMNISMINSYSFLTTLFEIFNEAEKTIQQSKDYYLQILISVIPYFMEGLMEKSGMEFKSFIDNIDQLITKRKKQCYQLLNPFQKTPFVDRLSIQWSALQTALKNNQKILQDFPRPYKQFQEELSKIKQIRKIAKINFSNKDTSKCFFISPCYITFFDEEDQQELGQQKNGDKISQIEEETTATNNGDLIANQKLFDKLLHQENILDIIDLFYQNKTILIQRLSYYARHHSTNSNPIIKLVFETIIAELLRLPTPIKKIIILASVSVTWSFEDSQIGGIIESIYTKILYKLEKLEPELIDRLTDFLSFYLSCVQLKWSWEKHQLICSDNEYSQKKMFFQNLFSKLSSLTLKQKIQDLTPIDFHKFIKPEKDKLINLRYFIAEKAEDCQNKAVVAIWNKLNLKTNSADMLEFLKSNDQVLIDTSDQVLVQKIFLECLFKKMYLTFTHLNVLVERYKELFMEFSSSKNFQTILIESIFHFWQKSTFHLIKYLEKFTLSGFIQTECLIEWIFNSVESKENDKEQLFFYWEILRKIMDTLVDNSKNLSINAEINKNKSASKEENLDKEDEEKKAGEVDEEDDMEQEEQDLQSQAKIAKEKEGDMLFIIFKRFSECFGEDEEKNEIFLTRLREFSRVYSTRLASRWDSIEEEFQGCKDEIKELIKNARYLMNN